MVRKVVNCREKSARCKCSRTSYVCPRIRATERAYRLERSRRFKFHQGQPINGFPRLNREAYMMAGLLCRFAERKVENTPKCVISLRCGDCQACHLASQPLKV